MQKFEAIPQYLEAAHGRNGLVELMAGLDRGVLQSAAVDAAKMEMGVEVAIEMHLGIAMADLPDQALFRKNLEIPIDRGQTDPGEAFANVFVNLIRRGVGMEVANDVENDLALSCHTAFGRGGGECGVRGLHAPFH